MSILFYREERDRDFFNVCEKIRAKNRYLSTVEIAKKAIMTPAKSFYIHPREYLNIIRLNGRKLPGNTIRRELHTEILRRKKMLSIPGPQAAEIIFRQSAPRFYISVSRAVDLYYELLKKYRKAP